MTTHLMGVTTRLLPSAEGPAPTVEGREARQRLSGTDAAAVDALTTLGSRAARRNNERG